MKRNEPKKNFYYEKVGLNQNWHIVQFKVGFSELRVDRMANQFIQSHKRLIIIDQEGVVPLRNGQPTPEAIEALDNISDQPENIVFVVSSEEKRLMHHWYAEKARHLGLAAENGFVWRWESNDKSENDWKRLNEVIDFDWMNQVKMIML